MRPQGVPPVGQRNRTVPGEALQHRRPEPSRDAIGSRLEKPVGDRRPEPHANLLGMRTGGGRAAEPSEPGFGRGGFKRRAAGEFAQAFPEHVVGELENEPRQRPGVRLQLLADRRGIHGAVGDPGAEGLFQPGVVPMVVRPFQGRRFQKAREHRRGAPAERGRIFRGRRGGHQRRQFVGQGGPQAAIEFGRVRIGAEGAQIQFQPGTLQRDGMFGGQLFQQDGEFALKPRADRRRQRLGGCRMDRSAAPQPDFAAENLMGFGGHGPPGRDVGQALGAAEEELPDAGDGGAIFPSATN